MSQIVDNYLELAQTAHKAGNNEQCEQYCNRILEIENDNAMAWALKGAAAGWQSSLAAPRVDEMLVCFGTAIDHAADDEQVETLKDIANTEFMGVAFALYDLQCNRFVKWPDDEEAAAFLKLYGVIIGAGINMSKRSGVLLQCLRDDTLNGILATKINNCAVDAEKAIRQEYVQSNRGFPTDDDFYDVIKKEGRCYKLLNDATTLGKKFDEGNIVRWQNMIRNHEFCISAYSFKEEYHDYGWVHEKHLSLSDQAVRSRRAEISALQQKISAAQERIRQRKISAYWEDHAEEKEKLENERNDLNHERAALQKERECGQNSESVKQVQNEIAELERSRAAKGFFALKEKKNLGAQIADRQAALEKLLSTLLGPLDDRLQQIDQRIQWITNELTRDR